MSITLDVATLFLFSKGSHIISSSLTLSLSSILSSFLLCVSRTSLSVSRSSYVITFLTNIALLSPVSRSSYVLISFSSILPSFLLCFFYFLISLLLFPCGHLSIYLRNASTFSFISLPPSVLRRPLLTFSSHHVFNTITRSPKPPHPQQRLPSSFFLFNLSPLPKLSVF